MMKMTPETAKNIVANSYKKGPIGEYLSLDNKNITANDLGTILRAVEESEQQRKGEVILALWNNNIAEKGCYVFRKLQLQTIIRLSISINKIGDKGCQQLVKAYLPHLQVLYIMNNQITEKGCAHLSMAHWDKLQYISLQNNPIGRQGFTVIKKRFPDCLLYCDYQYEQQ